MERKRWPWRKKSSQRGSDVPAQEEEHEVTLEDRAQAELRFREWEWEDKLRQLNEKLVVAMADAVAKDNAINQHAKVAEEAVSGWEKAEAEAASAKRELEEVVAEKVGIDERRHRLENSLKECTRQLQLLKDDSTRELDSMRQELAVQRASFLESKRISEVEVRVLQMKLDGVDRENSRLKYELHLLNKELEIRAEEREYTQKASEISHRQHLDSVRKIAKLEAECHRLRGLLVRKKLPAGPPRSRPNSSDQMLSDRLASTEEETKLLRETLAKRNDELQSTRIMCARTATKLSNAQGLLESFKSRTSPSPSPSATPKSHLHLLTSSESFNNDHYSDTNDDELSCAESWASALIAELSHFKKDKDPPGPARQIAGAEHVVHIVELVRALVASRLDLQPHFDKLAEAKDRLLQATDCSHVSEFLEALACLLDRAFGDGSPDHGIVSHLRRDLQACELKLSEITACNAELESRLRDSQQEVHRLQLHVDELQHQQLRTEPKMADLRDKVCIQTTAAQEEKPKKEREVHAEMEVAEASEKLAECQRTIQILGKQLKALASPANSSNKLNFSGASSFEPRSPKLQTTEPSHPDQFPCCRTPTYSEERSTKPSLTDTDYQIPDASYNNKKTRCPGEEEEEEEVVVAIDPPSSPAKPKHNPSNPIKSANKATRAPPEQAKSRNKFFTRLFSCTK